MNTDPKIEFKHRLRRELDAWQETGILVDDPVVVIELYRLFSRIADDAVVVSDYGLVWKDAVQNQNKLRDIIRGRYDSSIV